MILSRESLLAFALALMLVGPTAAAERPQVVLVIEQNDAAGQALGSLLRKELRDQIDFRLFSYASESLGNPIFKGRLVASLSKARLVVSVGNNPTGLALG